MLHSIKGLFMTNIEIQGTNGKQDKNLRLQFPEYADAIKDNPPQVQEALLRAHKKYMDQQIEEARNAPEGCKGFPEGPSSTPASNTVRFTRDR
jgi:hypothetical protein